MLGEPHEVALGYNEMNFGRSGGGGRGGVAAAAPRRRRGARCSTRGSRTADGRRTEVLEQGAPCSVHMLVEAHEPLEDPVCGFSLNDEQHRRVFATATSLGRPAHRHASRPATARSSTLQFDIVFTPGRYSVTPFVAHPGAGEHA